MTLVSRQCYRVIFFLCFCTSIILFFFHLVIFSKIRNDVMMNTHVPQVFAQPSATFPSLRSDEMMKTRMRTPTHVQVHTYMHSLSNAYTQLHILPWVPSVNHERIHTSPVPRHPSRTGSRTEGTYFTCYLHSVTLNPAGIAHTAANRSVPFLLGLDRNYLLLRTRVYFFEN